jgi:hypothetical protein
MPNPGSGACELRFNVSHREINFAHLTCCQFAQLLTQMRQLMARKRNLERPDVWACPNSEFPPHRPTRNRG